MSSVKFLSKEERAKLALDKRARQVESLKEKQSQEAIARASFLQKAQALSQTDARKRVQEDMRSELPKTPAEKLHEHLKEDEMKSIRVCTNCTL